MRGRLGTAIARFLRRSDGVAALEFALVAPVLIALVFGIMTFGYAFALENGLQELAADAARATVGGIDTTERQSLLTSYMAQASTQYMLLDASKLSYTPTFTTGTDASISLTVTYDLTGSVIDIMAAPLGLSLSSLSGSAYLVY